MSVHVVADTIAKLSVVRTMLAQQYTVTSELLSGASIRGSEIDAVVVTADLRDIENISALKGLSGRFGHVRRRVFLVDQNVRLSVFQAYALGATHVLTNPVSPAQLLNELSDSSPSVAPGANSSSAQETAMAGAASIASMLSAASCGSPVDIRATKAAGGRIADSIAEHGLSDWLTTVRRHHEGTYQHCLLVTGIAVDFGLNLGLAKADMERLYSAAMFHDIGKARIPLEVLDKPGRLDSGERALIETHPTAGYDILKENSSISAEILDAVRHHHEYLDGSGYPDALCAEHISDVVRILTICDIFAALIEQRYYKPVMPREHAYEVIKSMQGKLEKPLIVAFKNVALTR